MTIQIDHSTNTIGGVLNYAATQTIASATTTDIGAATSNSIIISGTTTITALGTVAAGAERMVQFSGSLQLTHNAASLILPAATNIQTAAGDVAYFVSLGAGNWRCSGYQKADGRSLVSSTPLSSLSAASGGNTIANGDNAQTWQWSLTTAAKSGFKLTELAAALNGAGSQYLVDISTLAGSTAYPLRVQARGSNIFRVTSIGSVDITGLNGAAGSGTTGSAINLTAGQGASTSGGGAVTIRAGDGGTSGGSPGDLTLRSGNSVFTSAGTTTIGTGTGASGTASLLTFDGASGSITLANGSRGFQGSINITGAASSGSNIAGTNISITSGNGNATTGAGGNLTLTAGSGATSGTGGAVTITSGGGGTGQSAGNITIDAGTLGGGSLPLLSSNFSRIAIGSGATANISGKSLALGFGTTAAASATAIGVNAAGNGAVTSTGAGAMALGGSYASGTDSFAAAIGNNTSTYGAQGSYSVAIGYQAKAIGSYSLAIGNTAVAQNNSNIAIGTSATANATSGCVAISAGGGASATGLYSVAIGYSSASAGLSYALGNYAAANQTGKFAYAGGLFAAFGDAQYGLLVVRLAPGSGLTGILTSDATAPSASNQLVAASGQAMTVTGMIIGKVTATAQVYSATFTAQVINNGGTLTLGATVTLQNVVDGITLTTAPTVTADNTNKALAITSGAKTSTVIRWVCTLQSCEITY